MRIVIPFTKEERIALWAVAAALIAPYPTWGGRLFLATEIAMLAFVVVAHWRVRGLSRPALLLALLAVPLVFAFLFPSRGFSLLVSGLVYVKLGVFAHFVYILVERCRNTGNVVWLAKNVILPVALILCLSALIDRFTEWTFFLEWHQHVTATKNAPLAPIERLDLDPETLERLAGVSRKAGFATRPSDIPPWALLGLAAGYWLWQGGWMRGSGFLGVFLVLMAATFSMPKRSGVITIVVAVLAFLLLTRARVDRRWKLPLLVLLGGVALVINWATVAYQVNKFGLDLAAAGYYSAISRLLASGITKRGYGGGVEVRYYMLPREIEWLLNNPRELFLGTGWNFMGGLWSKPHNTYIGLIVGGGLVSLAIVTIALVHLFKRSAFERRQTPLGIMGIVLLVSLCVEIGMNGYLTGRLDFMASTLTIWIAWSAILHGTPPESTLHMHGRGKKGS